MNLTYKDIIYNYKPISIVFKNDENIYNTISLANAIFLYIKTINFM